MSVSAVAPSDDEVALTVDEKRDRTRHPLGAIAVATAVVAGIALRSYTRSPMWLDEALTVNIGDLGLGELRGALERDGAPPLFYAGLAVWTSLFGTSDLAARSLPAVFSVLTLWPAYRMGKRRGGSLVAVAAVVLLATSPFAIRYATEARMYSLVALLATLGWLAVANALERPTIGWLAATGAAAGALLLTQYWAFYLVGATVAALLLVAWRRADTRREALLVAAAIGVGSIVLFAPWLPTFLSQARHTGTPWGTAPGPVEVAFTTLVDLGGGPYPEGQALAAMLAGLTVLALLGRAVDSHRIELDLRTVPGIRVDFLVAAAALLAGVLVGAVTNSAWASRYTSIAFPLVVLVAAFGLRSFGNRRVVAGVLTVAATLGLIGGVRNVVTDRTQAEQVALVLEEAGARPGDVVVYCPDQLGPDVHRALPEGFDHYSFPDLSDPRFVDWVDYAERMNRADPGAFAGAVLERAEGKNVFHVWMPGYRSLDKKCESVNIAFAQARPGARELLDPDEDFYERQVVWMHPTPDGGR